MFRSWLYGCLLVFGFVPSVLWADSASTPTESIAIRELIVRRNPRISSENAALISTSLVSTGQQMNVDPKLVAAIMSVESGFNHRAAHGGAMGLGQLMRGTAIRLGISDPFSITQNITATTKYVKIMMDLWQGHPDQTAMALASYLRGPDFVKRSKNPLSGRSKSYVDNVMWHYNRMLTYQPAPPPSL
ncbi:lytic transglycosylase domain-containing protein [bacterium]|nr:lytic transglycosylase domain-containing protein [bacterium]